MAGKGTLTVKVVGDASSFERTMQGVSGNAAKFGKAAAIGLGGAAVAAVAVGTEVLNTGAKLEAWRKKTDTVFEESAASVREWADKNNEIFGVTDDELAGLAASFGDLLKPMGFTSKEAADMAKDVVGLSGALSEWSGGTTSASEAADILSKAMLGERDGLKQLGISISEADVTARLAAKGQDKLTGAALEQAKAVATQELIFEKSTDAQKAFASGGNEALRAQNELKAGLGELREQMADRLLPIVVEVTKWAAENLPRAMDAAGKAAVEVQKVWDKVFPALKATFETFRSVVESGVQILTGIFEVFSGLIRGDWSDVWDGLVKAVRGAWDLIGTLVGQGVRDIVSMVTGIPAQIGGAVSGAFDGLWQAFRSVVNKIIEAWNGLDFTIGGGSYDPLGSYGPSIDVPEFTVGVPDLPTIGGGGSGRRVAQAVSRFHSGGTFHAPHAGGEGLALLKDGERVLSPGQSASTTTGGAAPMINLTINEGNKMDPASIGTTLAWMLAGAR